MKSYLDNWESIFGKKSFRQLASADGINRHQRKLIEGNGVIHIKNPSKKLNAAKKGKGCRSKKSLCPHCATINLVRNSNWETICRKCGYEGN